MVQSQKDCLFKFRFLGSSSRGNDGCDSFLFFKFSNFLPICKYLYDCVCVCASVSTYPSLMPVGAYCMYTHTHTHTHAYTLHPFVPLNNLENILYHLR